MDVQGGAEGAVEPLEGASLPSRRQNRGAVAVAEERDVARQVSYYLAEGTL